ncbi:thiamine pyrophosphokinase [Bifidobacterium bohemicum]|uniref:Thiamine diphosphokinase n=1 Tax=Bifidobacterium bohemicum DSM 22767 TaxID=1437606 RepID=A0A086ZGA9_9BIFI|nr:thiamine diphosphokinase [Bifidobacterium bohemicum]KFI45559.1 thi80 [Bifidobacterium bohemicum DSM 22767]SCC01894.1 thiamine pyrophosphokinase [Bifidobacterium bohemicum]
MNCFIFAAGTYYGNEPRELPSDSLVIAADGGLDHVHTLGIAPDIVIGDFDSAEAKAPAGAETITLPTEHDDTDMLSALKIGWSRGCRRFHIYGGLGGRIDHSAANLQYLALLARRGGIGFLFGSTTVATAVCNGSLDFAAPATDAPLYPVSVLSVDNLSHHVTEAGLKYELHDGELTNSGVTTLGISGVSNELLPGKPSSISVGDGTLLVTFPIGTTLPEVTTVVATADSLGPLADHRSKLLMTSADER